MASTLTEYLESQENLVREAALALPHQFSQCTYPLGPLRQAVYLCTTCPESRGLCSACSVACHTDHEQIELFPKRNFRCDCPTVSITHGCTLHTKLEEENLQNVYGQNFKGQFCRCGRSYDPKTERETMIQCLSCEDWFHESCCNLRERPSSREPSPDPHSENTGHAEQANEDALSETSSSGLPPPLISGFEYESFVCASCVSKVDILKRWAGTYGVMMVVRNSMTDGWRILGRDSYSEKAVDVEGAAGSAVPGTKRPLSPSGNDVPEAKRARISPSSCLAPTSSSIAQNIYKQDPSTALDPSISLGTGDIFLTDGFRQRWCHCNSCLPSLNANSFLLEEEEVYEPPEDPDSGLSLEELGMRALERIPRDRAIDGIHAFNEMRDDLVKFLRPFAQEGKVVNDADVKDFFASLTEAAKRGRK
ncbi:hypothetical protein BDQ12DRAFT_632911 [Crucibulum laeve]|uniref:UBR-type domain-containing protein n=1 Tax=Crucibulum laeve TaxID=68775 RepID=A0A5C3LXG4_9AGAR|nr:hypothetical protein BDQ12DRAFT_632911 [Crucibulum laeve]